MLVLEVAAVDEDVDELQQFELVRRLTGAHQLLPRVAGPAPDVFVVAELAADAPGERQQDGRIQHGFAAEERDALDPRRLEVVDDLVFELLRVFVAGLEIPDRRVEAFDAVERAAGDVQRIAHAFAIGDDKGLVVGDHALGHAPPVPLAGTGVVGQ